MRIVNHKGQHLAEYALIFTLVLAALTTIQTYVKRGLQGRYKDATDEIILELQDKIRTIKKDDTITLDLQYEPYYTHKSGKTTSNITTTVTQNKTEEVSLGGSKTITIPENNPNTTERNGTQTILSAWEAD